MPGPRVDPRTLTAAEDASAALGRCAGGAVDELLGHFPVVGDAAAQPAVDALVEALADACAALARAAHEDAHRLGLLARSASPDRPHSPASASASASASATPQHVRGSR
ncbi:MAG: hypothetical protein LWW86_07590 [Micrococcales bacterium]|nr:hypothetical protein [Micrococcales bacterium]